jgi:hypothetical protein
MHCSPWAMEDGREARGARCEIEMEDGGRGSIEGGRPNQNRRPHLPPPFFFSPMTRLPTWHFFEALFFDRRFWVFLGKGSIDIKVPLATQAFCQKNRSKAFYNKNRPKTHCQKNQQFFLGSSLWVFLGKGFFLSPCQTDCFFYVKQKTTQNKCLVFFLYFV